MKKCIKCGYQMYYLKGKRICNMCKNIEICDEEIKTDTVDHPTHYNTGKYEAIDVIEDWKLNFNLGNSVKYISRAEHKGNKVQDLKKAVWYLNREIERSE